MNFPAAAQTDAELLAALAALLGADHVIHGADAMAPYAVDWRRKYRGRPLAVVRPGSTAEVAAVMRAAASRGVCVVTQGGNTGLSGGATPDGSGRQLVLNTTRLNRIREIDPVNDTLTAEAGVVLQAVQEAAAQHGRLFPLSLAAEGSCTIGGNLATNAGGTAVLRYGTMRELTLGLEVVTAQGEVWDGLRALRKDNTGYALKDLLIGSEGTLGVITAAVLKLFPPPAAQRTALVAVDSIDAAMRLLARARERLGPLLTAFELLSEPCLELLQQQMPSVRQPFATRPPFIVLVEVSDHESDEHATAQLESLLTDAIERGLAADGVVAASLAHARAFWHLREAVSEAQALDGPHIKHDVALPASALAAFVAEASAAVLRAAPGTRIAYFGHLGDGNLHFNLLRPPGTDAEMFVARQQELNGIVHDIVVRHRGSISAEHGLGQLRRDENARYKSAIELSMMSAVKQALDPHGLLNPGKLLAAP